MEPAPADPEVKDPGEPAPAKPEEKDPGEPVPEDPEETDQWNLLQRIQRKKVQGSLRRVL